jgi:hypothetical protein
MSQTQVETTTSGPKTGKILRYQQVPETTHQLDWADLATLDLSKFNERGGKEELAKQLQNAIEQIGVYCNLHFGPVVNVRRILLHYKFWFQSGGS